MSSHSLQIHQFLIKNFLFTDDLTRLAATDSLLEQGIMDSTGVLELVAFLEDTFRIRILDEELVPENLDSVERISAFVEAKLAASEARVSAA